MLSNRSRTKCVLHFDVTDRDRPDASESSTSERRRTLGARQGTDVLPRVEPGAAHGCVQRLGCVRPDAVRDPRRGRVAVDRRQVRARAARTPQTTCQGSTPGRITRRGELVDSGCMPTRRTLASIGRGTGARPREPVNSARCGQLADEYAGLIWDERSAKRDEHPNCANDLADAALSPGGSATATCPWPLILPRKWAPRSGTGKKRRRWSRRRSGGTTSSGKRKQSRAE